MVTYEQYIKLKFYKPPKFKEPFEADLNRLNDVLRNGCPDRILRHCNEQDLLPVIANKAIENLENLWAINAHSQKPTPFTPEIWTVRKPHVNSFSPPK